MKIKDVINEGPLQDLAAIGKAAQKDAMAGLTKITGGAGDWANTFTLGAYEKIANKIATQRSSMEINRVADTINSAWQQHIQKKSANRATQMTLRDYQTELKNWLESSFSTPQRLLKIDRTKLLNSITNTDSSTVEDYIVNVFAPGYIRAEANPVRTIPDGKTINISIGGNPVAYVWNDREGAFSEKNGEKVAVGSSLHNTLLQQAIGGQNDPVLI